MPKLLHWICKQSQSLEEEYKPPTTARNKSQKDTILVVDDSINVRRFCLDRKSRISVELALDGQDALENS